MIHAAIHVLPYEDLQDQVIEGKYNIGINVYYTVEDSSEMAGVDAIAEVRKSWPEAAITFHVKDEGEDHVTNIPPSEKFVLPTKE